MNTSLFKSHNGIIKFYDGTIIAIVSQEYSHNGINNWEETFNPLSHVSTIDGITVLEGHLYKRVKHAGDEDFQLPYRIIPEQPEFQVTATEVQWKLEDSTTWETLFALSLVTGKAGKDGIQGVVGEGWNIGQVGYLQTRPNCCSSLSSSCTSCNPSGESAYAYSTFLSIGDGLLIITTAIIGAAVVTVDAVAYTHFSNDLITWTALSAATDGLEARYLATSITGVVYTDMRDTDYYSSKGVVYICSDGKWTTLMNVSVPSYMVKETTGSTHIGYMSSYTATAANALTATIVLSDGKLEIAEQTIDETAFVSNAFGDGIEITTAMAKPKVQVEDFDGFGLVGYSSNLDSENDLQVYVQDFISDGLTFENTVTVDGEQRDSMLVNVDDLISPTTAVFTGLWTSTDASITEVDGYDNIYVKAGDALLIDTDGVNVVADELSLTSDGLASIKVWETDSATLGIQSKHLHSNVANPLYGIEKDGSTVGKLQLRVDASSIGFDPTGHLEIPDNGVIGDHLHDNTCDNASGMAIINNYITAVLDTTKMEFTGAGAISIKDSYITGLNPLDTTYDLLAANTKLTIAGGTDSVLTNDVTITINEANMVHNDLGGLTTGDPHTQYLLKSTATTKGDVFAATASGAISRLGVGTNAYVLTADSAEATGVKWAAVPSAVSPGASIVVLDSDTTSTDGSASTYARSDHKHGIDGLAIAQVSLLQTALDARILLNTWYNNMFISDGTGAITTLGLILRDSGATVLKRLIVDANGNLDTMTAA